MPATTNLRAYVTVELAPLLPSTWRFIPYVRNLATIDRPTALLKLQTISRHAAAPVEWRDVDYVLTLIQPGTDPERALPALDDDVCDLLAAIDSHPLISWKDAHAVVYGAAENFAFDITLTVQFKKEAP